MTRLDRLNDNALPAAVDQLELDMTQLKTSIQFVGGASVVYTVSTKPGTYDWQGTIPDPIGLGYGGKLFLIKATAQNVAVLYANLYVDLYKGSPPVFYGAASSLADLAAGNPYFQPHVYDVPNDCVSGGVKQFYCQVNGDTTLQLSVKFRIEALDAATITITELN